MTNSANLTLPMFRVLPMTPLDGYMVSATGLLPSLKLLASSGPDHLRACALVGGNLLECALKSFLTHKDNEAALKKVLIRHDLEALWCMSVKHDLPIAVTPPSWCVVLNSLHSGPKFHLRYQAEVHGLSFPTTADMLDELPKVLAAVEMALTIVTRA